MRIADGPPEPTLLAGSKVVDLTLRSRRKPPFGRERRGSGARPCNVWRPMAPLHDASASANTLERISMPMPRRDGRGNGGSRLRTDADRGGRGDPVASRRGAVGRGRPHVGASESAPPPGTRRAPGDAWTRSSGSRHTRVPSRVQRACGRGHNRARCLGIGIDRLSVEPGADGFPVHARTARAGIWQLEGLTNLDLLPPYGALLFVGALSLVGGSGSPARVLALVGEQSTGGSPPLTQDRSGDLAMSSIASRARSSSSAALYATAPSRSNPPFSASDSRSTRPVA